MNYGYCKKISINTIGYNRKDSVNFPKILEEDIASFFEDNLDIIFPNSSIFINGKEIDEVPTIKMTDDISEDFVAQTNKTYKSEENTRQIIINNEMNSLSESKTPDNIQLFDILNQEHPLVDKNNKINFICFNDDILNRFKIFQPGNFEHYAKNLINQILKNKIEILLLKRSKQRNDRKYYADDIRKKIKTRFLKALKNALNQRLKYAGSKLLFNYLPQNFITDITKKTNRGILDKALEEVLSMKFNKGQKNERKADLKKYKCNNSVINYLEKNEIISEKSNYNCYKNMKYKEIYDEYLNSREFEENIIKIIEEENEEYAKKYIELALHLNDFFISDN